MLVSEGQWSEALADNNVRAIIRWLRKLTAEGDDVEDVLDTFSCWVQMTSECTKKELLTLCFSRCKGLWMFLDQNSFTSIHMLLQKLRNFLTLAQWARTELSSAHLWHGLGVPCAVCEDTRESSQVKRGCWDRERRALKQHIWLGQLVQWWGIMGLLPKYPEANEVKRLSQMWREMDQSYQKACFNEPGREGEGMEKWSSFIQGMVTELDRQHGCMWISEDCADQRYPPPNLQALLKLVLVPHIDAMSVQAVLMYFVLDMANFLQCKVDLLQSFCHAFTIPSGFSQQIKAFWLLDHGQVKASMEILLSPKTAVPCLSWQHRCVLHCLLRKKQPRMALRYLQWTGPALESLQDVKLGAEILLQNSCASGAWALQRKAHTDSDNMAMTFVQDEADYYNGTQTVLHLTQSQLPLTYKGCSAGIPPCPLSAHLYRAQKVNKVSPEELVRLHRKAVMEVRKPHPPIRQVVWPELTERTSDSREMFLPTPAPHHLVPSPVDRPDGRQQTPPLHQPVNHGHETSSESTPVSVSSFTSAFSSPLLKHGHPYVYESTLTLQRISALLADGENGEEGEEEESRTPSSNDTTNSLLWKEESMSPREGSVAAAGTTVEDVLTLHKRLNLHHQCCSEDDGLFELQAESQIFLSTDYEKTACWKSFADQPNIPDEWSSARAASQVDQSDCAHPEIHSLRETTPSDFSLEQEPPQNLLPSLGESLLIASGGSGPSAGTGEVDIPVGSSICPTQLQILVSDPTLGRCSVQTSPAPADPAHETSAKVPPENEGSSFQITLGTLNMYKPVSGAPSGSLPRSEPGAAVTADPSSLVLSQPYSCGVDFTTQQNGDGRECRQADKGEPTGWGCLGKVSQGAIRSARTRCRKGKRVKKA